MNRQASQEASRIRQSHTSHSSPSHRIRILIRSLPNIDPDSTSCLYECNSAVKRVSAPIREKLQAKLLRKQKDEGRKAITDADRRRWELPKDGAGWEHWQVPFDTDPDWPKALAMRSNGVPAKLGEPRWTK